MDGATMRDEVSQGTDLNGRGVGATGLLFPVSEGQSCGW